MYLSLSLVPHLSLCPLFSLQCIPVLRRSYPHTSALWFLINPCYTVLQHADRQYLHLQNLLSSISHRTFLKA